MCPTHQHLVFLLQDDMEIEDIYVDPVEAESLGLLFMTLTLGTNLEERQLHAGVAYFYQDMSAHPQNRMTSAIEAHVLGIP
jgi:hypothetical protein